MNETEFVEGFLKLKPKMEDFKLAGFSDEFAISMVKSYCVHMKGDCSQGDFMLRNLMDKYAFNMESQTFCLCNQLEYTESHVLFGLVESDQVAYCLDSCEIVLLQSGVGNELYPIANDLSGFFESFLIYSRFKLDALLKRSNMNREEVVDALIRAAGGEKYRRFWGYVY